MAESIFSLLQSEMAKHGSPMDRSALEGIAAAIEKLVAEQQKKRIRRGASDKKSSDIISTNFAKLLTDSQKANIKLNERLEKFIKEANKSAVDALLAASKDKVSTYTQTIKDKEEADKRAKEETAGARDTGKSILKGLFGESMADLLTIKETINSRKEKLNKERYEAEIEQINKDTEKSIATADTLEQKQLGEAQKQLGEAQKAYEAEVAEANAAYAKKSDKYKGRVAPILEEADLAVERHEKAKKELADLEKGPVRGDGGFSAPGIIDKVIVNNLQLPGGNVSSAQTEPVKVDERFTIENAKITRAQDAVAETEASAKKGVEIRDRIRDSLTGMEAERDAQIAAATKKRDDAFAAATGQAEGARTRAAEVAVSATEAAQSKHASGGFVGGGDTLKIIGDTLATISKHPALLAIAEFKKTFPVIEQTGNALIELASGLPAVVITIGTQMLSGLVRAIGGIASAMHWGKTVEDERAEIYKETDSTYLEGAKYSDGIKKRVDVAKAAAKGKDIAKSSAVGIAKLARKGSDVPEGIAEGASAPVVSDSVVTQAKSTDYMQDSDNVYGGTTQQTTPASNAAPIQPQVQAAANTQNPPQMGVFPSGPSNASIDYWW